MRILVFNSHFLPGYKGGGPIKTIKNLFDNSGRSALSYHLVTGDRDLGDVEPYSSVKIGAWNRFGYVDVYYVPRGFRGALQIKGLVFTVNYDLIYVNSFFSFCFSIYPQLLLLRKKQVIIIGPRGEFSQGALKLKSFKKKVFIRLYKLLGFHRKAIFQASSKYEAQDIKRVLGSEVDIRVAEDIAAQEFAANIPEKCKNKTRIIFVSRISPMKNLLQAIRILQRVKNPVIYDIYGPIEDKEYWRECRTIIEQLPAHVKVRHKGSLTPDQVVNTMARYDIFFMPSLGENYGHVIAEAFCAGLPVLIANTTPWRGLESKGIGWDISLSEPGKFASIIDGFAKLSSDEYQEKRKRVLDWAKQKFSQRDAIEANIAMFKYAYEKSRKQ